MMKNKTCNKCRLEKLISKFPLPDKKGYIDKTCLDCRYKNRNSIDSLTGLTNAQLNDIQYKYGISRFAYNLIKTKQNNCCAICKNVLKIACIDHCHKSEVVRGLLCKACNTGLGHFKDNPNSLRAAAEYLENHDVSTKVHTPSLIPA